MVRYHFVGIEAPMLRTVDGGGELMEWARILAYITGSVDQEQLLRNEYLAAENRILRAKLNGRLRFSYFERATLGEIGFRLGRRALSEVAMAAQPETILAWYRRLVARKFDGSQARPAPGRPRLDQDVEELIVRMARENRCSGGSNDLATWSRAPLVAHNKSFDVAFLNAELNLAANVFGARLRDARCGEDEHDNRRCHSENVRHDERPGRRHQVGYAGISFRAAISGQIVNRK
jgi:hypothetical protein